MDIPSVSVIIPTLNEEHTLPEVLGRLKELDPQPDEIIVVDGGSEDGTIHIANSFNIRVLKSPQPGRAVQLHHGAEHASGDHLVFLHADTLVPHDLVSCVRATLDNAQVSLGGFVAIMKGEQVRHWFTFLNYIKTYLCPLFYRPLAFFRRRLKLLFGDQVMFCRKADYLKAGGFDTAMTVMEEADLCLKMSRLGRIKMVHRQVYSSDRRVAKWGFWKANRIYLYITFGWALGVKNDKLGHLYTKIR
ncbi:MAG: TIGR04283 family arsenosugar biosynthesis glycosyltransferase [Roseivirga sp.]